MFLYIEFSIPVASDLFHGIITKNENCCEGGRVKTTISITLSVAKLDTHYLMLEIPIKYWDSGRYNKDYGIWKGWGGF